MRGHVLVPAFAYCIVRILQIIDGGNGRNRTIFRQCDRRKPIYHAVPNNINGSNDFYRPCTVDLFFFPFTRGHCADSQHRVSIEYSVIKRRRRCVAVVTLSNSLLEHVRPSVSEYS